MYLIFYSCSKTSFQIRRQKTTTRRANLSRKKKERRKQSAELSSTKSLYLLSMATLSFSSLNSLSSSFSSSTSSSTNHFLPQLFLTRQEIPTLSRYSSKRRKLFYQPTRLILHPVLLLSGFDKPLDTQTFLTTISVLAAIALSLFLGLKGDPVPCDRCAGNGISFFFFFFSFALCFRTDDNEAKYQSLKWALPIRMANA
ncbi:hypothetical protein CRYUN_Cryun25bG0074100 [Craigia yunnanensis]